MPQLGAASVSERLTRGYAAPGGAAVDGRAPASGWDCGVDTIRAQTGPDDRLPTTSLLFTTDLQRPPRKMLSLKMSRDLVSLNLNAGGKPWCAVFLVF